MSRRRVTIIDHLERWHPLELFCAIVQNIRNGRMHTFVDKQFIQNKCNNGMLHDAAYLDEMLPIYSDLSHQKKPEEVLLFFVDTERKRYARNYKTYMTLGNNFQTQYNEKELTHGFASYVYPGTKHGFTTNWTRTTFDRTESIMRWFVENEKMVQEKHFLLYNSIFVLKTGSMTFDLEEMYRGWKYLSEINEWMDFSEKVNKDLYVDVFNMLKSFTDVKIKKKIGINVAPFYIEKDENDIGIRFCGSILFYGNFGTLRYKYLPTSGLKFFTNVLEKFDLFTKVSAMIDVQYLKTLKV